MLLRKKDKKQARNSYYWSDPNLNILIPMAGAGSRFKEAGYIFPKPLIEIDNKPMIQWVIESLNLEGNFIFLNSEKGNLSEEIKNHCYRV